jgi:hypothetical protein
LNKKDTVTSDQRSALKQRVDAAGRTLICEISGMRYTTMTQKLNGQLPLSPEDFQKISAACDPICSKQSSVYQRLTTGNKLKNN